MESFLKQGTPASVCKSSPPAAGFTLVELMIVLAVALVLLAMAVPEFSALVLRNQINAASSDLYASLSLARNEAIKRRKAVEVCPSDTSSEDLTCRNDEIWTDGWIVREVGTTEVIRASAVSPGLQMQADNALADTVQFNPTGDAVGTAGEFRICHGNSNVRSRAVRVSAMGRIESADRNQTHCNAGT